MLNKEAVGNYYLIQVLVIVKTYSSFLNCFSSTHFAEALKSYSIERIRVFLLIESVQTSQCGSGCEREKRLR